MLHVVLLICGFAALTIGGEALIRGALSLARRAGVSPLLAGLLILGFGTSAPELVVSVGAALNDRPDIAIGNVIGSNIGNVLLILGACAVISPLRVDPSALRRDGLTMAAVSAVVVLMLWNGTIDRLLGALLVAGLAGYMGWAYWSERYNGAPAASVHAAEAEALTALPAKLHWSVLALIGGLAMLVLGSRLAVEGAVGIATALGVPDAVIGVTIVAVGTSLPELSVSVVAALRRHADVAVGNILGSNIFNSLGILGCAALAQPLAVNPRFLAVDAWVMLGSALAILVLLYTSYRLVRWEGALLLAGYAAYVATAFAG